MKALKIILIIIGAIVALLFIALVIYWLVGRQGVVESFDVGSPELEQKVLIASQGSDFKNALVESLTTHLHAKIYIKVIDVTTLAGVDEKDWDAIVIIHTTEQWKLQPDVKKYFDRARNLNKVVLVTTSGSGDWETKDYDIETITSASKTEELPTLFNKILARLDAILKKGALE